ncbi:MAG TPA: SRPBCC family protein [Actinomycetales bacterium]|nr:SRPBCC family protein [Actinomycetales bacterium]
MTSDSPVTTWDTHAAPDEVWAVLADGWSYAGWVVGASRIRSVEPGWPSAGTRIHHSAGSWPILLNDETTVLESQPGRRLVLQAEGWPFGEATVDLTLEPRGSGCRIMMREDVTKGLGRVVPKPARQLALKPRNRESLRRLALLAERATHG